MLLYSNTQFFTAIYSHHFCCMPIKHKSPHPTAKRHHAALPGRNASFVRLLAAYKRCQDAGHAAQPAAG